jgi:hypothetical protein
MGGLHSPLVSMAPALLNAGLHARLLRVQFLRPRVCPPVHDHGFGFVRNGDPAPRTDAQPEHGGASNLLISFRDQATLRGRPEVETLGVVKPERTTARRQRLAGRRLDVMFVVAGLESQSLPSYLKETFTFVR